MAQRSYLKAGLLCFLILVIVGGWAGMAHAGPLQQAHKRVIAALNTDAAPTQSIDIADGQAGEQVSQTPTLTGTSANLDGIVECNYNGGAYSDATGTTSFSYQPTLLDDDTSHDVVCRDKADGTPSDTLSVSYTSGGSCASPGSERLYPNSHPATTATWAAQDCSGSAHHLCVDDTYGAEDDGGTFLYSSYIQSDDNSFGMTDTATMGSDCSTSTVVVTVRAMEDGTGGDILANINIGGSERSPAEGTQAATGSWSNLTFTFTGTWTKSEVDAMTVRVRQTDTGSSNNTWVTAVSALVNYE